MEGDNNLFATMRIIQTILFWASIIIFIAGSVIYLKNKKITNAKKEEDIGENEKEELLKTKNQNKKNFIICSVVAIIMFFVQAIMGVYTSFSLKPIIYLYPEKEQQISVELGYPEKLECVYPKYENSWEVLAKPNGDLTDIKTGRNLYALYWEGRNDTKTSKFTEGFCIKSENVAEFLEEKLAVLGLTEREAEEFIVYWLPKLEKNKYNLIRFETMEQIEENMPLKIQPKPDTIIRVMMDFKGSNRYVELPEQQLKTPERKGFVAVEWGGTEIK